jgi:hypothetical protein
MRKASAGVRTGMFLFAVWAIPVAALAQQPVAILREGDVLEDFPITLNNVAVNGVGGYAIGLTAGTLSQVWGSATGGPIAIMRTEGTFGPLVQTGFESFWGFANSGSIAYSATGTGGPVGGFDSVWLDDTAIAVEGDPVPSLPGQFWVFASRPSASTSGEPWWVSGYSSTSGGSTQARGLFRGVDATPVLVTGDEVGGIAETVNVGTGVAFSYRISNEGTKWMGIAVVTSSTATDNVVVINGDAVMAGGGLVREGSVIPVGAGGDGVETYQAFASLAVNESGNWLLAGDSNAATTADAFVMINGQIVLREGAMVGGFPTTGAFDWADLNENGDWIVSWNVNDGTTREALIFNGELLIRETAPIDRDGDGLPDTNITLTDLTTGIDNMYMSDRFGNGTVDIYFTADTRDLVTVPIPAAIEVYFRLTVQARCPGDFNNDDVVTVPDIFAFLSAWFAGLPSAEFDGAPGITVPDIFAFLSLWFAGCE